MRKQLLCFHVALNKKIMQCQDVDHIIAFCEENVLSVNCVNVSTALNRLAKLKDDNLPGPSLSASTATCKVPPL